MDAKLIFYLRCGAILFVYNIKKTEFHENPKLVSSKSYFNSHSSYASGMPYKYIDKQKSSWPICDEIV